MMAKNLGAKVRQLRRREQMTQAHLAARLGVSASYLNLIENNRRPLTAALLLKVVDVFQLDLRSFADGDEARLVADLMEAFGDPLFQDHALTNADVRELAFSCPSVARSVLTLYRKYQEVKESAQSLAARLSDDDGAETSAIDQLRLPSEEVNDLIQRRMNHFPELEEAAEKVWRDGKLNQDDLMPGLVRLLEKRHGVEVRTMRASEARGAVRRYDPERRILSISELLPPHTRSFQIAHQLGLLSCDDPLSRLVKDDTLTAAESRSLARVALANYFAGAVLMPYQPFLEAARSERYDIELLQHRFRTSFEQASHRLTTLQRPGAEGIPFHFMRVDIAGNISKRFSASGIRFARFSGACPRWNVHAAFMTPGMIRIQLSRMTDGTSYFCVSRAAPKEIGKFTSVHTVQAIVLGCRSEYGKEMVYADGVDLDPETAVPVGVTCRLCDRMECEQRVFPPLTYPLRINENVRGASFYAPPVEDEV